MAKKKNYVTRDEDGTIAVWVKCPNIPVKDENGDWNVACDNVDVLDKEVYKAFIGNLPRRGTYTEFKRGDK